ncbi:MAG: hypothetical protein R3A45_05755 [Bdellovibrionota bacterium]
MVEQGKVKHFMEYVVDTDNYTEDDDHDYSVSDAFAEVLTEYLSAILDIDDRTTAKKIEKYYPSLKDHFYVGKVRLLQEGTTHSPSGVADDSAQAYTEETFASTDPKIKAAVEQFTHEYWMQHFYDVWWND